MRHIASHPFLEKYCHGGALSSGEETVLCHLFRVILRCFMSFYVVYFMSYYVVLWHIMLFYVILCCFMSYYVVLCHGGALSLGISMRCLANSRPGLQMADSDEEEEKEEENEEENEEEEGEVEEASSTSRTSKTTGKRSTIAMISHNTCDTQAWATGNSGTRNTLLMASLEKEKQKQVSNNVCSVCLIIYVILCCFMSYYVVLCHIMLFYVILCCFISFHVISFAHVLFMLFYVIIC